MGIVVAKPIRAIVSFLHLQHPIVAETYIPTALFTPHIIVVFVL